MKIFHIATRREYTKDGELKRKYYKTGELTIDEATGKMYMRLYQTPDINYYFFDTEEEKLPAINADTNTEQEE